MLFIVLIKIFYVLLISKSSRKKIILSLRVYVYIATSLDGFIARRDGSLDWLSGAEVISSNKEDYGFHSFFGMIDTVVMGRKTFEKVLTFGQWPYKQKKFVLLSNNLKTTDLPYEVQNEEIIILSGSPKKITEELKKTGSENIYVDGGETIQLFLKYGQIDEIIITKIPILLGNGVPLFGKLDQDIHLKHISTNSYPSGFVQSRYIIKP